MVFCDLLDMNRQIQHFVLSHPLVQTVNAFYLQLLEMQKAFTSPDRTPDTLPSLEAIKELQIEYTNMLTAIIDLLDGAKYLWEGDCHEQQS